MLRWKHTLERVMKHSELRMQSYQIECNGIEAVPSKQLVEK